MQPVAPGALRVLHLSDTHLTGDGTLHQGSVDTTAVLDTLLDGLAEIPGIGLVVVSGDCSEDGSAASYQALHDRLLPFARDRGAALVAVPGNHDGREGFRQVLGNGHVLGEGGVPLMHTLEYHPPTVPVDGVSVVAGRRIVTLDTSVPGAGYGELRPAQLDRLRAATVQEDGAEAGAVPLGTVIVLHHPPLPAPTALHEALRLQDPEAFARALDGSDVRAVLAGHYHHHFAGSLRASTSTSTGTRPSTNTSTSTSTSPTASASRDLPVLVAPGVANDTDVTGPYESERANVATGALVVDLAADGSVRSTPVRVPLPDDGRRVVALDAEMVRRIAREAGPRT